MKYDTSCLAGLETISLSVECVCVPLAGLSVESNHVIGEEGSSITVDCTYSAKYRYAFFFLPTVPHV